MRKAIAAIGIVLVGALPTLSSAGEPIETKVTIGADTVGNIYGTVKAALDDCADGRKVVVKRKRPGKDEKVGSDTTEKDSGKFRWSGNFDAGDGRFYAKAPHIGPCKTGTSKVIRVDQL